MKKLLLIFALALVLAVSNGSKDLKEFIQQVKKKHEVKIAACVKESQVDPNVIIRMQEKGEFAEDVNLKCYFKCIFNKFEFLNADGTINSDSFDSFLHFEDKTIYERVAGKCKANAEEVDECVKNFDLAKCIYLNISKIFQTL